jgi:hypothetical protein
MNCEAARASTLNRGFHRRYARLAECHQVFAVRTLLQDDLLAEKLALVAVDKDSREVGIPAAAEAMIGRAETPHRRARLRISSQIS